MSLNEIKSKFWPSLVTFETKSFPAPFFARLFMEVDGINNKPAQYHYRAFASTIPTFILQVYTEKSLYD